MQRKLLTLLCLLLFTTILVMSIGAYLKYEVLGQFALFGDKNLIEAPFAALEDPAARFAMESLRAAKETEPPQMPEEEPTEPPVDVPAFGIRIPMKTPPAIISYEAPTEPPLAEVTEEWFDDVLFIGDSRTVGLREYARLGNADYFCSVGLTVFGVTSARLSDENFSETDLEGLLSERKYNKIYISLGLNECGAPHDLLMEAYGSLMDTIRRHQPHAVIILEGMITVSRRKAATKWYFGIDNLQKINRRMEELADGVQVLYIDANELFADEEGYLPPDLTPDGCHFYISGYQEWADWLFENAKTLQISFG